MKTVYRQDGTAVDLDDETAAKWLRMGLATSRQSAHRPAASGTWTHTSPVSVEPIATKEGEQS
jgi:hypothetical protein